MALLISFAVPLTNMAAVHALVKKEDHFLLEMIKNPLLMGTVAGITFNLLGLHMPDAASAFLRSEEHTSELQSLMRISYAVFCLKKQRHTYVPIAIVQ